MIDNLAIDTLANLHDISHRHHQKHLYATFLLQVDRNDKIDNLAIDTLANLHDISRQQHQEPL